MQIVYGLTCERPEIMSRLLSLGTLGDNSVIPFDPKDGLPTVIRAEPRSQFKCAHCSGVNRWMLGNEPPHKCRYCGAPPT